MKASVLSCLHAVRARLRLAVSNVGRVGPVRRHASCAGWRRPAGSLPPWRHRRRAIRPMNSLITLRWNQGGRKVSSATIQRGGKTTKSRLAVPGGLAGRGQHGEDRRVGMVEAHRADGVEAREIVFVGRVVAVPGDDVERRVVDSARPEPARRISAPPRRSRRGPRTRRRASGNRADWRGRWRRCGPSSGSRSSAP